MEISKKIVVLGAGRSSIYLLEYLDQQANQFNWHILACDRDADILTNKIGHLSNTEAVVLDIENENLLNTLIEQADLVVSLLPPPLHPIIARKCLNYKKHLATASYVSPQMQDLHEEAKAIGLIFLNEMGLDPGIDHMSAMAMIESHRKNGAELISFESYCGGLIASDFEGENPWKYKFSWNPKNVILAGQGSMSLFKKAGHLRLLPYSRLFANAECISVPNIGVFDAYPNRDSLAYVEAYSMQSADTVLRGTLRRTNYCKAWNVLIQLGFTDNVTFLSGIQTFDDLANALTGKLKTESFSQWLANNEWIDSEILHHFEWIENYNHIVCPSQNPTAAEILQITLEAAWKLEESDKDEVVMVHKFTFSNKGQAYKITSSFCIQGEDSHKTAMAKTVGLPLAMGAEMILNGEIKSHGVVIPVNEEIYSPVLLKLAKHGIQFSEQIDY